MTMHCSLEFLSKGNLKQPRVMFKVVMQWSRMQIHSHTMNDKSFQFIRNKNKWEKLMHVLLGEWLSHDSQIVVNFSLEQELLLPGQLNTTQTSDTLKKTAGGPVSMETKIAASQRISAYQPQHLISLILTSLLVHESHWKNTVTWFRRVCCHRAENSKSGHKQKHNQGKTIAFIPPGRKGHCVHAGDQMCLQGYTEQQRGFSTAKWSCYTGVLLLSG